MFSIIKKSQDNWTKNKQKIKKHNQIIKPYESTVAFENFLRKNKLLSKQTNHIVDIGTGIGSHLDYLSKKNNHIEFTGIDYSSRLLKEAKKLKRQNNINFLKINILKKNKNKSISNCDGVICIQTFCCFKNAEDPIKFICNLKPKWIAINSLFYDGPLDIQIHIKDYEDLNTNQGSDGDFNTFSIQEISKVFRKYGYNLLKAIPFYSKKKLPKVKNRGRGSYTMRTELNKNTTFSGPVHLPWHFLLAKKIRD